VPNLPSRRKFLCSGAALALTATYSSSLSPIARGSDRQKTRVGIIGSTGRGDYGHGVDEAFAKIPEVEITALADADNAGRENAAKRTQPKTTYADYREMLANEKLDLVAICPRWIDQHHDMILAAAQAGCHIYMEKPFCRTLAECDEAIKALEQKKLKLAIAHTAQYSPVLEVVKSLIAQGEIGTLLELRARGKEDRRGGGEDLWVLGSHMFALMRSLAGSDAESCFATVTSRGRAVTKADVVDGAEGIGLIAGDHIEARYSFKGGVSGHFASRRDMGGAPGRFAIQAFGSKGIIEMESGYLTKAHILRDSSWSPGRSGKPWEPITSAGIGKPEPRSDGSYEGGHIAAITDLIECISQDRQPKCSANDARAVTEMIAAVFESHRLGKEVKLPLENRQNPLSML
jgi:predicted dehydrogenase